jgi:hypothetical protein
MYISIMFDFWPKLLTDILGAPLGKRAQMPQVRSVSVPSAPW